VARTSKADWIESGFVLLRTEGEHALTIERLCGALGRTKGSFYHHFESADVFATALLDAWEERNTEAPITASREGTHAARRRSLDATVKTLDWALDLAVRGWGLRDKAAREVVARVDARRIAYLESLLPRTLPRAKRRAIATLEYAAFLGAMQLDPLHAETKPMRDAERLLYEVLAQWLPESD
jgi:AcrR family transcriptional regulator